MTIKYKSIGISAELKSYLDYLKVLGVYDSYEEFFRENLDVLKIRADARREKYDSLSARGG